MKRKQRYNTKAIPLEYRMAEKRSKLYSAMCNSRISLSEKVILCQELLDSYLDLCRLKALQDELSKDGNV